MRIGIIGAGASGLIAAWLLQEHHDVTVFEKQDRLGGHAHTVDIAVDGKLIPIDAGLHTHDIDSHESAILSAVNIARRLAAQSSNLSRLMGQDRSYNDGRD